MITASYVFLLKNVYLTRAVAQDQLKGFWPWQWTVCFAQEGLKAEHFCSCAFPSLAGCQIKKKNEAENIWVTADQTRCLSAQAEEVNVTVTRSSWGCSQKESLATDPWIPDLSSSSVDENTSMCHDRIQEAVEQEL